MAMEEQDQPHKPTQIGISENGRACSNAPLDMGSEEDRPDVMPFLKSEFWTSIWADREVPKQSKLQLVGWVGECLPS